MLSGALQDSAQVAPPREGLPQPLLLELDRLSGSMLKAFNTSCHLSSSFCCEYHGIWDMTNAQNTLANAKSLDSSVPG